MVTASKEYTSTCDTPMFVSLDILKTAAEKHLKLYLQYTLHITESKFSDRHITVYGSNLNRYQLSRNHNLILIPLKAVFSFVSEVIMCKAIIQVPFYHLSYCHTFSHWLMKKHHVIITCRDPLYNIKNILDKMKQLIFLIQRVVAFIALQKHFCYCDAPVSSHLYQNYAFSGLVI